MNDRLRQLEEELASLQPRPVSTELTQRIEQAVSTAQSTRWADRCLWSAIVCGAVAACLIVATILNAGPFTTASPPMANIVTVVPRLGGYSQTMAQADVTAMDGLK